MKLSKKVFLCLVLILCVSLCACGTSTAEPPAEQEPDYTAESPADQEPDDSAYPPVDPEWVYEQAKVLNIQLNAAGIYRDHVSNAAREPINLLLLQSTEYLHLRPESYSILFGGIYMLDMDTGIWYDSTFLDMDKVISYGGAPDLSRREDCLMHYFCLYGEEVLWGHELIDVNSLSSEELASVNQRLLLDDLTKTTVPYPYASVDDEPRRLSDEEIKALYGLPHGLVRSAVSTVPDAIAYMDFRFPELWMGMSVHNGIDTHSRWLRSARETLVCTKDTPDSKNVASRACVVNCLTYLLEDDYEIESLIAFWPDPYAMGESGPEKAINAVKTASGYLFFDPVTRMQGDVMSRYGDLLPEMTCSSVAEYIETIRQNPALSSVIKYIFKNTGGVLMNYQQTFTTGFTIETDSPGIEMVYYSVPPLEPGQHIKPENIGRYMLSTILGGTTLTPEEAYALVDAEPEVVQEKVRTAADVLMYMMASRMIEGAGCYCTDINGHTWHWNMDARTFMKDRRAGCGQCANLGRYLLDGDYEEIGFVDHTYFPGGGGGHIYNYILHEGKYYIVDFSSYYFSGYEPTQDFKVPVLNTLEEWGTKIHDYYRDVCLSMAYNQCRGFPVVYGDDNLFSIPEDAEMTILYDAGSGFTLNRLPFDRKYYDWDTFQDE